VASAVENALAAYSGTTAAPHEYFDHTGVQCLALPARSPNLNAYAERWVRSIKEECLAKLILFGERSLQCVVSNYLEHYHQERNHRGKDNVLLFPAGGGKFARRDPLSGAARWLTQILQPRRMSIFTIRDATQAHPRTTRGTADRSSFREPRVLFAVVSGS